MQRAKSEVEDAQGAEDAAGPPPVDAAQSLRTARGVVLGLIIGLFVWGVLALSWWRWA